MTNLGTLMVCALSNFFLPLFAVAYTLNKAEKGKANERYIGIDDGKDPVGNEVQQDGKFL